MKTPTTSEYREQNDRSAQRSPAECIGDRTELTARAKQLQAIADRVERFLLAQVERFEEAIEQAPQEASLMQPREQVAWDCGGEQPESEAERQKELIRIREAATWLNDAWRRLESEQRKLLGEREMLRSSGRSEQVGGQPPAPSSPADAATHDAVESDQLPPDSAGDPASCEESAWLQFQQLRREIQQHARRSHR